MELSGAAFIPGLLTLMSATVFITVMDAVFPPVLFSV